jgi:nitrous oxide reductase
MAEPENSERQERGDSEAQRLSRRQFLQTAGIVGAGAALSIGAQAQGSGANGCG